MPAQSSAAADEKTAWSGGGGAVGLDDQPSTEDLLNINKYALGLATFISQCPTPMTIAIQGEWGSGKTSTLNMLRASFRENSALGHPEVITFDTWQHAQVGSGDGLVTDMVRAIFEEPQDEESETRVKQLLRRLAQSSANIAEAAARAAASSFLPEFGAKVTDATITELRAGFSQGTAQAAPAELDVRTEFAALIGKKSKAAAEQGRNPRIVVLVDDLDRLHPVQAVEVMEALKSYLDVKNCVFVLAVDFDVVVTGVKQKYPSLSDAKARAFFDKIIQLPFRMPVHRYDMTGLIGDSLEKIGVPAESVDLERVASVVDVVLGPNPRAVKRLVNNYSLLREIEILREGGEDGGEDVDLSPETVKSSNSLLIASLAVQSRFPLFYDALVREPAGMETLLQGLTEEDPEIQGEWEIDSDDEVVFLSTAAAVLPIVKKAEVDVLKAVAEVTEVTQIRRQSIPAGDYVYTDEARRARLAEKVSDGAITAGESLKNAISARLGDQPFSVLGQAGTGTEWTLQAIPEREIIPGGKAVKRWGLMQFTKNQVVLQLESGAKDSEAEWAALQSLAARRAQEAGLELGESSDKKKRVRLRGISTPEHIAVAADIAARAYAIRVEGWEK